MENIELNSSRKEILEKSVFEEDDLIYLYTKNTSYVFSIAEDDALRHFYWGSRLIRNEDLPFPNQSYSMAFDTIKGIYPYEFQAWKGRNFLEPHLKVFTNKSIRNVDLVFQKFLIDELHGLPHLLVELKDEILNLVVQLHYLIYYEEDIISRWVSIKNIGNDTIYIDQIYSACWNFPLLEKYRFSHLAGRWAQEMQINRNLLTPGKKIIESRRGTTSHQANPWFAIDNGYSTEDHGEVWFGTIAWSGNWQIEAELNSYNYLRVVGGLNPFDFRWKLGAGSSFRTPIFFGGYTKKGFTSASHNLHKLIRNYIAPENFRKKVRPVLYNSWEATTFSVNVRDQMKLAEIAADLGVELFVVDDGWFGARNNDRAGLGDWIVNKEKFPNGLEELINYVNDLGMDFGLWFEPEMVNPDSDLYRNHPDWVLQFPNRKPELGRNQLNLNVARNDVAEFIFNAVDNMLSNYNIKFIKWDMNKHISDPGWPDIDIDHQQEIWVKYVNNLYSIFEKLRRKHPDVLFESCSGGGGRIDLGILKLTDQVWTSDNTNPYDRLIIQEGFSFAYPTNYMVSWVTDSSKNLNFSLEYRFHSSMMGVLGIGANLHHWTEANKNKAKELIAKYKEIRNTIQFGKVYRLLSSSENNFYAIEYVSNDKDEVVLFVFKDIDHFDYHSTRIKLKGLEENALYFGEGIPGDFSGKILMDYGLDIFLTGNYKSQLFHLKKK